jgi:hypothetical protein
MSCMAGVDECASLPRQGPGGVIVPAPVHFGEPRVAEES